MNPNNPTQWAQWLENQGTHFMASPANDAEMPGEPEQIYDQPLWGYAAGDDDLWTKFKEVVHPDHWTPAEAFGLAFPEEKILPEELAVVSWILPQTAATRIDQRAATTFASERWIRYRFFGQPKVNDGLARYLLAKLAEAGVQALAPDLLPEWKAFPTLTSNWSHRHAAFAAGLGTFGLSDGLITAAGQAMRTGSIVVRLKLSPTPRPYQSPYEYCLFYNSGVCGKCIKRCPCGAISPQGHDKAKCRAYLFEKTKPYYAQTWPDLAGAYGCGLCQAAVPCENKIPPRPAPKK